MKSKFKKWSTFRVKNESLFAFENDDRAKRSNGHTHTLKKGGKKLEHHLILKLTRERERDGYDL